MTRVTGVLLLLPFALLLVILPFPGTVALRLLCLSLAFVIAITKWRRLQAPPLPLKPVLLAWAALALLSLLWAVDPAYSLGEIKNELGYTMMAFAAFFAITDSAGRLRGWLWLVLGVATLIALWALWVAYAGGSGSWDDTAAHGGRGTFASLATMALPLALPLWRSQATTGMRAAIASCVVTILAAAVIGEQRILWAALAVQGVIALVLLAWAGLLRIGRFRLLLLLVGSVLAAGTALLLVHERKVEFSPAEYQDLNRDARLEQWGRVMHRIEAHPLVGAGFGREAMKKAYPDLVPDTPPLSLLWHPHNVFLTYGVAMGFPGMLMLAVLFAALIGTYLKHVSAGSHENRLLAIIGVALVAGVVTRNLTNDLFLRDGALMFWALNGALLGWLQRQRGEFR